MFAPGTGRYLAAALGAIVVALGAWGRLGAPWLGLSTLGAVVLALWLFFAWFFRDPVREPGQGIVSAADGKVRAITEEEGRWRISVFMNVTDVHVNRAPLDSTVERIEDGGDGFRPAYVEDALHNVRRHYHLATDLGPVEVVQLTGIVARRLVSFVRPGDRLTRGDRFGMIILGSRVDVLLPADRVEPVVTVGQRVHAGRTPIARVRAR